MNFQRLPNIPKGENHPTLRTTTLLHLMYQLQFLICLYNWSFWSFVYVCNYSSSWIIWFFKVFFLVFGHKYLNSVYSEYLLNEVCVCVHAQSLPSCLPLCDPMNCSPPASSVLGILQARILQWVVMPSSRGSFISRYQTHVSCIAGGFGTH